MDSDPRAATLGGGALADVGGVATVLLLLQMVKLWKLLQMQLVTRVLQLLQLLAGVLQLLQLLHGGPAAVSAQPVHLQLDDDPPLVLLLAAGGQGRLLTLVLVHRH